MQSQEQFEFDLTHLYLQNAEHSHTKILPIDFLSHLIKEVISPIYNDEFFVHVPLMFKLPSPERYELCLSTFFASLVACTRKFPPELLIQPDAPPSNQKPRFTYQLSVFTSDGEDFTPIFKPAFEALCKPIIAARSQLAAAQLFTTAPMIPYAWEPFSETKPHYWETPWTVEEPYEADRRDSWRRSKRTWEMWEKERKQEFERTEIPVWEEWKRKYEQAHKEAHSNTPAWQTVFHYTPYFERLSIPTSFTVSLTIPYAPRDNSPRFAHTWILGASNAGKTNLLRNLILEDLKRDDCVIIMDSKGQLLDTFLRFRPIRDRTILVRPDPQHPIAINPFDTTTDPTGFLEYIFGGMVESDMTKNMSLIFRHTIKLLQQIPGATIEDFVDILEHGTDKYSDHVHELRDPSFFTSKFGFKSEHYMSTKNAVYSRLKLVLDNDAIRNMLTSPKTKFNIKLLMDTAAVILIDNRLVNASKETTEFLGRLFLALIRDAAIQRSGEHRVQHPVHIYIDEADEVIERDPHVRDIIDKCRSQLVSLTVAHQGVDQLQPSVRNALERCWIKFFNTDHHPLPTGTFLTSVRGSMSPTPVSTYHEPTNINRALIDYPVNTPADIAELERHVWAFCDPPRPRKVYEPPPQERPEQERRHEPRSEPPPRQERRSESPHNTQSGPKPGRRRKGRDTDVSGEWPE